SEKASAFLRRPWPPCPTESRMYGYMFFIRSSPHLLPVPYSVSSHMLLGKCVFSHALPSPPLVSLHQGESYEFLAKAKILDEIQNQI
ncbi:putative U2 snRNP auxiliary factor large subunit protein, partial [Naja naja]